MDNPENNKQASDGAGTSRGSRGRASSSSTYRGRGPRGRASSSSPHSGRGPRGRTSSSSPHRGRGPRGRTSSSSPHRGRGPQGSQQAPQGNEELIFDENITDTLRLGEVINFLFRGHQNEHIAQNLLNPDIGAPITCAYCSQSIIFDNAQPISRRHYRDSRNHHYHIMCYFQSVWAKTVQRP